MTAKRLAIFDLVETRARALAGVAEVLRLATGDPSRFPALFLEDNGQQADSETEPGVTRYSLGLTIEGYVEGDGGAEAHAALNSLYMQVVAMMLAADLLGGLAEEVTEGDLRIASASLTSAMRLGFALDFNVQFVADRAAPAA